MKQGDIYLTDFEPSIGHEYQKERPAIVISGNNTLKDSMLITVMATTSNVKNRKNDDIMLKKDMRNNLHKDSLIKVSDIYSFDPKRFKAFIGTVDEETMKKIKAYIPKHFDL